LPTADGTAVSTGDDADYIARTGTLSFGANETSKTVAVEIRGDLRGEVDESFSLNLTNATNSVIGDAQGIGTILNDDTPACASMMCAWRRRRRIEGGDLYRFPL
jgi:hypothetical protein